MTSTVQRPAGEWSIECARCTLLTVIRKRFLFRGTIQGVGFRPAIYRLAVSLGLPGFVQNRRSEVVAEVQGDEEAPGAFRVPARRLPSSCRAHRMPSRRRVIEPRTDENGFQIVESAADVYAFPPIPPDLPVCADCARELLDPAQPPVPLPLHHLHPVRPAVLDRASARPSTGRTPRCSLSRSARRARPSTRTRRTGGSTPRRTRAPRAAPRLACIDAGGRPPGRRSARRGRQPHSRRE